MKVKSSKGFTLAELLIVMAIIVVLAAVAIPTFGRQLETARETSDMETLRNAYEEALAMAIIDVADGKLDGAKGTTSLTTANYLTATAKQVSSKNTNDEAVYSIKLQNKIKQTDTTLTYVNNVIAGKEVKVATKDHEWANFRFKLTDGVLVLDVMDSTSDITTSTATVTTA